MWPKFGKSIIITSTLQEFDQKNGVSQFKEWY